MGRYKSPSCLAAQGPDYGHIPGAEGYLSRRGFLLAVGAAICGGCTPQIAGRQSGYGINLIEQIEWVPLLTVERSGNKRIGRRGNRREGLLDIRELARVEQKENGYFYFPQREIWIEAGRPTTREEAQERLRGFGLKDTAERLTGNFRIDMPYLYDVLYRNRGVLTELECVHFHPRTAEEIRAEEMEKKGGHEEPEVQRRQRRFDGIRSSTIAAMPSEVDLALGANAIAKLSHANPILRYSEGAATVHGISTVSITYAGVVRYSGMEQADVVREVSGFWRAADPYTVTVPENLLSGNPDPQAAQKHIVRFASDACKRLSNGFLSVGFEEF